MTTQPDRVHVKALGINFVWHNLMSAGEATRAAETILTSTDPAVLDAMQDALVRAGRLRRESESYPIPDSSRRRFVTEWTETDA